MYSRRNFAPQRVANRLVTRGHEHLPVAALARSVTGRLVTPTRRDSPPPQRTCTGNHRVPLCGMVSKHGATRTGHLGRGIPADNTVRDASFVSSAQETGSTYEDDNGQKWVPAPLILLT